MVADLAKKYTGAVAEAYETDRAKSWKWRFEHEALAEYLSKHGEIENIVDIPCGTGRFHDLYKSKEINAVGVDVSADMLRQADDRGMMVQERDLFTYPTSTQYDAVVCFRFLNWVNIDDLEAALSLLIALSKKYVFMSLSTTSTPSVARSGTQYFPSLVQLNDMVNKRLEILDIRSAPADNGVVSNIIAGRVL